MRRREFIALLGGATVCPLAAQAQQAATPTIGFLSIASRDASLQASWYHAFHERFFDHGWVPGKTIAIEYRFHWVIHFGASAEGRRNHLLKDLIGSLTSSNVANSIFWSSPSTISTLRI